MRDIISYDKTKDKTIDICLTCTKKTCTGLCTNKYFKQIQREKLKKDEKENL